MENNLQESKEITSKEALASWEAPDFVHHDRDVKWYLAALLVVFGFLAYSIYTKDWYFIFILVLVVTGAYVYLKASPQIRHYSISELGIQIDNNFYFYNNLHSFWIIYEEKVQTLNFMHNKKFVPAITIQLDGQDPLTIQNLLKNFLPEEEGRGENFSDKITRILKF